MTIRPGLMTPFVTLCFAISLAGFQARASAQAPAKTSKPESPAADPLAEARERYARLQLPETDDANRVAQYIAEVKLNRPRTTAEAVVLKFKIRSAARRLMELEKDAASPAYRRAESELMEANAALIGQGDLMQQRHDLEQVLRYLRSRSQLTLRHAAIAQTTAATLEAAASTLTGTACDEFAMLFGQSMLGRGIKARFDSTARRSRIAGAPFPLTGSDMSGQPFDIAKLEGKIVLVDFWATWCQPCLAEHPRIEKLLEKHGGDGLVVVGVSMDEDRGKLERFLRERPLPWTNLFDDRNTAGRHKMAARFGIERIPAMVLVDRQGRAVALERDADGIARQLAALLK